MAWFSILSGAVLWKTYANRLEPRNFYKKRIFRLFIPLWLAYAFFYIASYIGNPWVADAPIYSLISSLLGMDFYFYYFTGNWDLILVGEWYTSIIISLYLLFPLMHYLFSRFRKWGTLGFLVLFILNLKLEILTTNGGRWSVVNAITYFWMGMLFESQREKIVKNKPVAWMSLILSGILFVAFRKGVSGVGYLITFLFSVFSFVAAYSFSALFDFAFPVTRYLANLNYEIYLTHHRIQYLLIPVFLTTTSNRIDVAFMFIVTTAVCLLISEKLSFLTQITQKKLLSRSKNS